MFCSGSTQYTARMIEVALNSSTTRFADCARSLSATTTDQVAAVVAKEAFWQLDAPVDRLCVQDIPMPYHPDLMATVLPSSEVIANRVRDCLKA